MIQVWNLALVKITNEGGLVELEKFGIRIDIPPNALTAGQRRLIKISVITDLTKYVTSDEDDDEIIPAFGIQCLPNGLEFNVPVTLTIPHCVKLSSPGSVTPILYSGRDGTGMLSFCLAGF